MHPNTIAILNEDAAYLPAIHALHAEAFGPGRFAKAAFRLREQGPHSPENSFIALNNEGALIGAVWMTKVTIGKDYGFLLGPLAVLPTHKSQGIGRTLMKAALDQAGQEPNNPQFVVLVGDPPYYAPFGFKPVSPNRVSMPGPVAPGRLLIAPLNKREAATFSGEVRHIYFR